MMRVVFCFVPVILAFTVNLVGQGSPPPPRLPPEGGYASSGSTQPVSPVAMATWKTRYDHNGHHTLELLILWRGRPGWYLRPGPRRTSSGGNETGFSETSEYGGVELRLQFDVATRVLQIQGKRVELGDNNVVLVDSIDVPGAAKVMKLLRINPEVPATDRYADINPILAASVEIVAFLQCGAQRPGAPPLRPLPACVRALENGSALPQ